MEDDNAALREEHKLLAQMYAQGDTFTDDELLQLIDDYSLNELALIVMTYENEAFVFLGEPKRAQRCMLQFAAAISAELPDAGRPLFNAALRAALEESVKDRDSLYALLPVFDYVPRGDGTLAIEITFPDEEDDG